MQRRRLARPLRLAIPALAAAALGAVVPAGPAAAQAIAAVVNGDPITTTDVDQQMVFLKIIKRPASRADALEQIVSDQIKLRQANKYGIDASDQDLSSTLARIAASAKLTSQGLADALQKNKAATNSIRNHLHALAAWDNYVRARNKSLSVSEEDVTAAIARMGGMTKDATDYTLQQIVVVVPVNASQDVGAQRQREAQALRTRFDGCGTGLALARALPDVAIKPAFNREAKDLAEGARKELEQTQSGRLTQPQRSGTGFEMIAICAKDDGADRTTLRDTVQANLVRDRLAAVGDQMYKELRATAVVEKR